MARKANPAWQGGAAVVERSDGLTDCRISQQQDHTQDQLIDPRLAFLARADARYYLVQHGFMSLGEAVAGLIDSLEAMAPFLDEEGPRT